MLPENSIEGVQAAFACGAFAVEIDVRQTADDDFIVVHDEVLSPDYYEVKVPISVRNANLFELTNVSFGHVPLARFPHQEVLPTKIPSLDHLLQEFSAQEKRFIIEVKVGEHDDAQQIANSFYSWLEERQYQPFRVQSFSLEFLRIFNSLALKVDCHWLIEEREELQKSWPIWLKGLGVQHNIISEEVIARAAAAEVELAAWTVNSLEEAQELAEKGVTELITDHPQLLLRLAK